MEIQLPGRDDNMLQDLLSKALATGNIDIVERFLAMQTTWREQEARRLYFKQFAAFQAEVPEIRKTRKVYFGTTEYFFAPLGNIVRQIRECLHKNELVYRWEISEEGATIRVTCLVSHVYGHTERTTMTAAADEGGSKNKIQARGSTITYLQRYTLIAALGLATADQDIDGQLPEYDVDAMHKEYMTIYNELIQLDSSLSRWHPDNWKQERTGPVYARATKEILKRLQAEKQKSKLPNH